MEYQRIPILATVHYIETINTHTISCWSVYVLAWQHGLLYQAVASLETILQFFPHIVYKMSVTLL